MQPLSTIANKAAPVESAAENDEQWAKGAPSALTRAEAANPLRMPGRRVARPTTSRRCPTSRLEGHGSGRRSRQRPAAWGQRAKPPQDAAMAAYRAAVAKDGD